MVDKADTLTFIRQHEPPAMVAGSAATLYVHIPFCRHLCPFCPYNKITYEPALAARYIGALRAEIRRAGEQCGRLNIGSLYFGGGTPTTVLDELDGVMDDLRDAFAMPGYLFGRDPDRDFAGILRLIRSLGFVENESDDWLALNTRGCHWVHPAQNLLALNDINVAWSAARTTAFPGRISL